MWTIKCFLLGTFLSKPSRYRELLDCRGHQVKMQRKINLQIKITFFHVYCSTYLDWHTYGTHCSSEVNADRARWLPSAADSAAPKECDRWESQWCRCCWTQQVAAKGRRWWKNALKVRRFWWRPIGPRCSDSSVGIHRSVTCGWRACCAQTTTVSRERYVDADRGRHT